MNNGVQQGRRAFPGTGGECTTGQVLCVDAAALRSLAKIWPSNGQLYARVVPRQPDQQILHAVLNTELVNYLRIRAGREQSSVSALLRTILREEMVREKRARMRKQDGR
jgi:hypothetical protein